LQHQICGIIYLFLLKCPYVLRIIAAYESKISYLLWFDVQLIKLV
jgi:hypothetical protein